MATTEFGKVEILSKGRTGNLEMSIGSTVGGLALMVLGILALDKVDATVLNSVAVIVAGVVFLFESASLSSAFVQAFRQGQGAAVNASQLSVGMNTSMLAGITGVVLGILAILGLASTTLAAVAVIVFGAAVMLDRAARAQTRAFEITAGQSSEEAARIAEALASSTNMAGLLAAAGLVTLGILALAGTVGEVLIAVSLLGLGTYLLLEGSAIASYLLNVAS